MGKRCPHRAGAYIDPGNEKMLEISADEQICSSSETRLIGGESETICIHPNYTLTIQPYSCKLTNGPYSIQDTKIVLTSVPNKIHSAQPPSQTPHNTPHNTSRPPTQPPFTILTHPPPHIALHSSPHSTRITVDL